MKKFTKAVDEEAVLGLFSSSWYSLLTKENNWIDYFTFGNYFMVRWENIKGQIVSTPIFVHDVYKRFRRINFLLDGIALPLNSKSSVTCGELEIILEYKYTDKVQFWLKGQKVETEKVLNTFKLVGENNITFDNLDLNTII